MKTEDAIRAFGNGNRLAKALGISRASISQWGEDVPALRAYQIREILDGRLPVPAREPSKASAMRSKALRPVAKKTQPETSRSALREAFVAAVARLRLTPARGSDGRAGRRSK